MTSRKKRVYSKNGCETCKRRKVKCDETYPRCRRCESTGRACNTSLDLLSVSSPTQYGFVMSSCEGQALEWFKLRTVTKLPGTFRCDFWSKLVLQAAISQPAPRYAALALGASHKCLVLGKTGSGEMEMLALRHHSNAIMHLQPWFSTVKDANSLQVVLIVCIIFASLDSLRGHLVSAQCHIESGLAILKSSELTAVTQVDEWITEAFVRLQIQLALLRPSCTGSVSPFPQSGCVHSPTAVPRRFRSLKLAWDSLSVITTGIISLHQSHVQSLSEHNYDTVRHAAFVKQQHAALSGLRRWQTAYQHSHETCSLLDLSSVPSIEKTKATANIQVYHILTTIMAHMCLCSEDEMAFDTQNLRFTQLLQQLQILFGMKEFETISCPSPESVSQLDHSIIDLGCIIPLYYLATKCRVYSLRMTALQMLQSVHHREGLWDAKLAALVAHKIIQLEEGGIAADCVCRQPDPTMPTNVSLVPHSQRIGSVEIVILGNPTEKIRIFGTTSTDRRLVTCVAEINVTLEALPFYNNQNDSRLGY